MDFVEIQFVCQIRARQFSLVHLTAVSSGITVPVAMEEHPVHPSAALKRAVAHNHKRMVVLLMILSTVHYKYYVIL